MTVLIRILPITDRPSLSRVVMRAPWLCITTYCISMWLV